MLPPFTSMCTLHQCAHYITGVHESQCCQYMPSLHSKNGGYESRACSDRSTVNWQSLTHKNSTSNGEILRIFAGNSNDFQGSSPDSEGGFLQISHLTALISIAISLSSLCVCHRVKASCHVDASILLRYTVARIHSKRKGVWGYPVSVC